MMEAISSFGVSVRILKLPQSVTDITSEWNHKVMIVLNEGLDEKGRDDALHRAVESMARLMEAHNERTWRGYRLAKRKWYLDSANINQRREIVAHVHHTKKSP